jgi:ribosomal protein RSM22 (predicted rRNA methylase)
MEQRPISLHATQTGMRDGEADTFIAAVMPQIYASAISVLVETRKRLGGQWLRGMAKEGGPAVLDVGGGGAAALAWRDVMRAELGMTLGRATVVTGSETLRYRASRLLENTTFIPRLPEPVGQESQPRKRYDVIVASHLLWPIKEDYMRKDTVQTLWSLLNPNGGVLILLEKGVPRGFEVVAGARQLLLEKHVASPGSNGFEASLEDVKSGEKGRYVEKETGMIVAPCTNHGRCPLYRTAGVRKGRKDWCYFSQRYFRPGFLQKILGAKSRNYDDVEFSYLSVMRGRDHRLKEFDPRGKGFEQGDVATERAANGYGPKLQQDVEEGDDLGVVQDHGGLEASIDADEVENMTDEQDPHPLSLPRTILQPIKRKGHVLIDVCTPSGTLERWVVNRKCGKQVFRDARKAQWGDLWALGAKSRTERRVKLGRSKEEEKLANKRARKSRNGRRGAVGTVDDEDMRDLEDLES